jgi:hypothetical protein
MLHFLLLKCTAGVFETENDCMYAHTGWLIFLFCLSYAFFLFWVLLCFVCLSVLEFILAGGGDPHRISLFFRHPRNLIKRNIENFNDVSCLIHRRIGLVTLRNTQHIGIIYKYSVPAEEKKSPSALPKPKHHISRKIQAVCCHNNTKNISL